jgi:addiction module RelE/StbE family toxin
MAADQIVRARIDLDTKERATTALEAVGVSVSGNPVADVADRRRAKIAICWRDFRDLHIEPDWLLIYRVENDDLQLARTGSQLSSSPNRSSNNM